MQVALRMKTRNTSVQAGDAHSVHLLFCGRQTTFTFSFPRSYIQAWSQRYDYKFSYVTSNWARAARRHRVFPGSGSLEGSYAVHSF